MTMKISPKRWITASIAAALALLAGAASAVECIVPSKPGGAMDLTCKLLKNGLPSMPGVDDMHISYMPGGIGAVAWHTLVLQRRAEPDTLVAFSGGSLLNLAQGKFGKARVDDVRWVAALGVDYGMIAVPADSPFKTLPQLIAGIKRNPEKVLIGVAGTIGSQDWTKMALLVKSAGIDPKVLHFVAFEGGGESFTAMQAGHVQLVSGDVSEAKLYAKPGSIRALVVLSEQRLPGAMADVPTAREHGIDVVWPIIRGFWMGPQVTDAAYQSWVSRFDAMQATPQFAQTRTDHGMYPLALTGPALTAHVRQAVDHYAKQASDLGVLRQFGANPAQ